LKEIAESVGLSEQIKGEVAYLFQYYSFMNNLLDRLFKSFETYFGNYTRGLDCFDSLLKVIWLIICYIKKTALKRKNDNHESSLLICCLLDEIRLQLLNDYSNLNLGTYDKYLKAVNINDKDSGAKVANLKTHIKTLFESLDSKDLFKPGNLEATYNNINERYGEVLMPEEIDDMLIYNSYRKKEKGLSNSGSASPFNLKSGASGFKETYEGFIKSLDSYFNLDISYLSIKMLKNNYCDFTYKEIYEEFENKYILHYNIISPTNYQKLVYNKHKSLFLKLNEEFLNKNQAKISEKDYHRNFLIISFYVYIYLLFVEEKSVLNTIIYDYCDKLNLYCFFDISIVMNILINLNDSSIPTNIKTILKSFTNVILSHIIWQKESKFSELINNKEILSNEYKVNVF
jgi:hypothetical protein